MRTFFEQLAQDLRYGVRGLRRSHAFLLTTVLTLAVGVGLLAVAFTVVNAYLLRPYAVRDPQQLHQVGWRSRDGGGQRFRPAVFMGRAWNRVESAVEGVAAYHPARRATRVDPAQALRAEG